MASRCIAAVLVVGALLVSSRADADLLRPSVPIAGWSRAFYAWMPPRGDRFASLTRPSLVWTSTFSSFSIGLSALASARPSTLATLRPFGARREPLSLCIGAACPGRAPSSADVDLDPGTAVKAGSVRLITDLGPLGVTALGLFTNPVASKDHPVVMRVAPIFALSGGGLEMRCAWW